MRYTPSLPKNLLPLAAVLLCLAALHIPAIAAADKPYKKKVRDFITRLARGERDRARDEIRVYLKNDTRYGGEDPEALFALTLLHAAEGEPAKALSHLDRTLAAGVPFERFLAGPRRLTRPLLEIPEVKARIGKGPWLLHGPAVGAVTDRSARFWMRSFESREVRVRVWATSPARPKKHPNRHGSEGAPVDSGAKGDEERTSGPLGAEGTTSMAAAWISKPVRTRVDRDFTAVAEVTGLSPGTRYAYEVLLDGKRVPGSGPYGFTTFASPGQGTRLRVAFGGGAGYTPWKERMWNVIADAEPDALLLLGDNVYIDTPKVPETQSYCYYRRQSRPEFRSLLAGVPAFAIWDDHDFGTNDCVAGRNPDHPSWKRPVWELFKRQWNNPDYGAGAGKPGCYFAFTAGDVDFFMLDGRFFRTDPKMADPTMLGLDQNLWLRTSLAASRATFKVIVSPVPWATGTKPGSLDTWDGFPAERKALFDFLAEHDIEGVVLLSADRHRTDIWRIERERGYPLYEFESSRLTNVHVHKIMPGAIYGYNAKCSFGLLDFDTTLDDPELLFTVMSIDGEAVHEFRLRGSWLGK